MEARRSRTITAGAGIGSRSPFRSRAEAASLDAGGVDRGWPARGEPRRGSGIRPRTRAGSPQLVGQGRQRSPRGRRRTNRISSGVKCGAANVLQHQRPDEDDSDGIGELDDGWTSHRRGSGDCQSAVRRGGAAASSPPSDSSGCGISGGVAAWAASSLSAWASASSLPACRDRLRIGLVVVALRRQPAGRRLRGSARGTLAPGSGRGSRRPRRPRARGAGTAAPPCARIGLRSGISIEPGSRRPMDQRWSTTTRKASSRLTWVATRSRRRSAPA